MSPLEPAAVACLERTRSAVVNVLVGVGLAIALSGVLLRGRDHWPAGRVAEPVRRGSTVVLVAVIFGSYAARRVLGSRSALREPERRADRFYRAHLLSAAIGALAIPLGLALGWTSAVAPLRDVAPFWVAGLALGVLAIPRALELEGFEAPMPAAGEAQP